MLNTGLPVKLGPPERPAAMPGRECASRRVHRSQGSDSARRCRTMEACRVGLGRSPICSAGTIGKPVSQVRRLVAVRQVGSSVRPACRSACSVADGLEGKLAKHGATVTPQLLVSPYVSSDSALRHAGAAVQAVVKPSELGGDTRRYRHCLLFCLKGLDPHCKRSGG